MNVCGATDTRILDLGVRPPWLDPEVVCMVIPALWCYTCPTTILPINLSLSNCFITREANTSPNAFADREKFIFNKKAIGLAAVAKLKSCKILNISSLHYHSTTVVKW